MLLSELDPEVWNHSSRLLTFQESLVKSRLQPPRSLTSAKYKMSNTIFVPNTKCQNTNINSKEHRESSTFSIMPKSNLHIPFRRYLRRVQISGISARQVPCTLPDHVISLHHQCQNTNTGECINEVYNLHPTVY